MGLGGVLTQWLQNRGAASKAGSDELAAVRAELWKEIGTLKAEHKAEIDQIKAEHRAEMESFEKRNRECGTAIDSLKAQARGFRGELADVRRVFAAYRSMVRTMIWKVEMDDPDWRKLAAILKREGDADLFDVAFGGTENGESETPVLTQKRILVVDDFADARTPLITHLKNLNYATDGAASGIQALELLEQATAEGRPFDLLLLDHAMPNLSGAEVAAILNTMDHKVKVVFVTGHGEELREIWRGVGAHALWTKPLEFEKLGTMVSEVLNANQT
ncbi:sporulation initiation phosphotransferase F [Abditibacteriota bacterium]|nr:sporulation initiation phosphotransferase F [Abditibacteriota bacterium]